MMNLRKIIEITEREDHAYGLVVGSSIAFYDNERREDEAWIGLHFDSESFGENKRDEKSVFFQPDDLDEIVKILRAVINEHLNEASVEVDWGDCDLKIKCRGDNVTVALVHEPQYNLTVSVNQIKTIIKAIDTYSG